MKSSFTSRRTFIQAASAGAASLMLPSFALTAGSESPKKRPNVLFIAIDDLNDWIGCLGGHPDTKTPNLDALAARGVLFTHAYCAAPLCNPSRSALLTGVRPSTSGIYANTQSMRKNPLLKNAISLPQHFKLNGYHTLGAGKIFHETDPVSWNEFWPSFEVIRPKDPSPTRAKPAGAKDQFVWGPLDVPNEKMGDWQITDWVSAQLAKDYNKPFFLGCGFYKPHLPWHAPQKYFDMFPQDKITLPKVKEDDLGDIPEAGRKMASPEENKRIMKNNAWRATVQAYLACIAFVDECVGRVVRALDDSKHRDNTIICLWSDHGWHLGEKLHWRKSSLWEEATRNILTFVAPGITKENSRCDAPVSLMDIYPTMVELCDLPNRKNLEGESLISLLRNPSANRKSPAVTNHRLGNYSVRSSRWRYTRYADGSEELYDHSIDEMEWTNLAGDPQYAAIKSEHAKWIPQKDAAPQIAPEIKTKKKV